MTSIQIEPALEPRDWKRKQALVHEARADRSTEISLDDDGTLLIRLWVFDDKYESVVCPEALWPLIALANDALPDNDPRKIDREWIDDLQQAAEQLGCCDRAASLKVLAKVLSGLLPPQN